MSFQDAALQFEQSPPGTDSFKALHRALLQLMREDAQHAAVYFVIGAAAHNYVMRYEDQGVAPETAERCKQVLVGYHRRLLEAWPAGGAGLLATLSAVANDYEWSVREF